MSLKGLEPAPLNPNADRLKGLTDRLSAIAAEDPATVDEEKFIELSGDIADALHMGEIDFPDHDRLTASLRDAWGKVV